jgi:hypothetical protein
MSVILYTLLYPGQITGEITGGDECLVSMLATSHYPDHSEVFNLKRLKF